MSDLAATVCGGEGFGNSIFGGDNCGCGCGCGCNSWLFIIILIALIN